MSRPGDRGRQPASHGRPQLRYRDHDDPTVSTRPRIRLTIDITSLALLPGSFLSCSAQLDTALAPDRPPLLDGDTKQVGQQPLRVSPCLRTSVAGHLVLSAGPE